MNENEMSKKIRAAAISIDKLFKEKDIDIATRAAAASFYLAAVFNEIVSLCSDESELQTVKNGILRTLITSMDDSIKNKGKIVEDPEND